MTRILVVAAHPDDEILGCGGTIARLVKEGNEADILILGEGPSSRLKCKDDFDSGQYYDSCCKASEILGAKFQGILLYDDNKFDTFPLLDITQVIECKIDKIKPDIIFTHFKDDLNIDHRITYQAIITATRPILGQCVKEIYSFEIPSSTEWAFPTSFSPDVFWDIENTFPLKLEAMQCYESELREWPHPRSEFGLDCLASYRGMQCGFPLAEAFKTVRVIR